MTVNDRSGTAPAISPFRETKPGRARTAAFGYLAVFAWLCWPWLQQARTAFPTGNNPVDSRLITFILAWVARTLPTHPSALFDAPMAYPAPAQLTGSESFLSSGALLSPVFYFTTNAVLAVNALALSAYPLGAFAMERLVTALGISAAAAWLAGLTYALGPCLFPASVQVVQFLPIYPPLVALALLRLRQSPTPSRSIALGAVLGLAALSSYYMALLAALTGVLWAPLELARAGASRMRFLAAATIPAVAVAALLLVASRPYMARQEAAKDLAAQAPAPTDGAAPVAKPGVALPTIVSFLWPAGDYLPLGVAPLGLLAILAGAPAARFASTAGAIFALTGTLLIACILGAGGLPPAIGRALAFFRNLLRLQVLTGFGVALLCAAALDLVRRWAGARAGFAAAAVFAVATLATRGIHFVAPALDPVAALGPERAAYEAVRQKATENGGGALLELPLFTAAGRNLQPEALAGQTVHRLPIVNWFTAFWPFHELLLSTTLSRLPARDALQDLVDVTHVRWILLRPSSDWRSAEERRRFAQQLAQAAGGPSWPVDGFLLQQVDLPVTRASWFDALAGGFRPGSTILGTPLAPLDPSSTVGKIEMPSEVQPARAEWIATLLVKITNNSAVAWPGGGTTRSSLPGEIFLEARWIASDPSSRAGADQPTPAEIRILRDIPAGESLAQLLSVATPKREGDYDLELRLRQRGNASMDTFSTPPARARVRVAPPATARP